MSTRLAFLRGINVGGNQLVPMAELRSLLGELGFSDVRTYIQSGNVVYTPPPGTSDGVATLAKEAAAITDAIRAAKGFAPAVMVYTADTVAKHLARSPYRDTDPSRTFIVFVDGDPAALEPLTTVGTEELAVIGGVIHLHFPDGLGRSKLAAKLAASKRPVTTTRNVRTIAKLLELAAG